MADLRAMEIFSCLGGMAEGFRRAGIQFEIAVDMDPDACDSYESNMGHRPLQENARKLLRYDESRGPWDLIVADPPCTPWSRAGKRKGLKDGRDMFRPTIGILDVLRPRCWVIGNVPGLDDADNWQRVVKPMLGAWAWRSGYCVDYGKFDCADYGVPQRRRRPFWFGHPKGTPCIRWPQPTHAKPTNTLRMDAVPAWVTCRDALGHLPLSEIGRPVQLRWKDDTDHRASSPDEPAKTLTTNPNSDGALLVSPKHPACMPGEPAPTLRSGGDGHSAPQTVMVADPRHNSHVDRPANVVTTREARREHVLLINPKHPICEPDIPARTVTARDRGGQASSVMSWPWDRPATTVMADPRIPPPGHHGGNAYMSDGVVLGETARLILQGFPGDWVVCGKTKGSRDSQIGQAMPPPMAMRVAESILEWFAR